MFKGRLKWVILLFVVRFFLGFTVGRPKTNATWAYSGDRMRPEYRKATKWAYLAGWQRMVCRWIMCFGSLLFLWVYSFHYTSLMIAVKIATVVLILSALGCGYWIVKRIRHTQKVVRPILNSVAPYAGLPPNPPRPGARLKIPLGYQGEKTNVIRLNFDADTWRGDPAQRTAVNQIMTSRLGGEWDVEWNSDKNPPYALWRTRPHPPGTVPWIDIESDIYSSEDDVLILGRDTRKELEAFSLDSDAPHVALSIGTGGGKSSTLRLLILQLLIKGVERIDILDPKRVSLKCFDGIKGVYIHKSVEAFVEAITDFKTRMDGRYSQLEVNDEVIFPRHAMIVEEGNSMMAMIEIWWNQIRTKSDPKSAPVIADFNMALFQARQARMHVFMVLQQANAKAMGGSAARDQFGLKILARFSPQVWRMLIGTTPWRSSKHMGRAVLAAGEDPKWIQLGFVSEADARRIALEITDNAVQEKIVPKLEVVGKVERFTLKEIADMEIVPVKYGALRAAKVRDDNFPIGYQGKFSRKEIITWYNNRQSTTTMVAEV